MFRVTTFNKMSSWSLGTFLIDAADEAAAIAAAEKNLGIPSDATVFRHVVENLDAGEKTVLAEPAEDSPAPDQGALAAPVTEEAVTGIPAPSLDDEQAADILEALRKFGPDVLGKLKGLL